MQRVLNYIDGTWVEAKKAGWLDNLNPATGQKIGEVSASTKEDVEAAVAAAKAAFYDWSTLPSSERARLLTRLAELIELNLDSLARAETDDTGKPLRLSQDLEIPRAAANFRFFAEAITQFASESHYMEEGSVHYTLRQPVGVCAAISPWNLPLYLFSWKVAPALVAGNTLVAKPSEVSPTTAFMLSELSAQAGLPHGVFNVLHGRGEEVGRALVEHPDVKAVSFTGSTRAGREIAQAVAPAFKKLHLEMGGKNPVLIFEDAPWEKMLETVVRSSFSNQGQICLCGSRILVEESVYSRFRDEFVARTKDLSVGDPLEDIRLGALVSKEHFEKVSVAVERAKEEGAKVLCGGESVKVSGRCEKGYFYAPTVLEGLPMNCQTNQEEIFGPVVTIMPFKNEQEALRLANDSDYGLCASVWTEKLSRASRLAEALDVGMLWINSWLLRDLRTPFGGVKSSGLGREGGLEALRFFTEPKNICIDYRHKPRFGAGS